MHAGLVHYEIAGQADDPIIVLVHGFSVPSFVWDAIFQPLASCGFRVMRYDLYGRGQSDRPKATYNADFLVRQLSELITALGLRAPVNLVGLSMGCSIVAAFSQRYPEYVSRVLLLAPAGLQDRPTLLKLLTLPLIGEMLFALFGRSLLLAGFRREFARVEDCQDHEQRFRRQSTRKGYRYALLSTLRGDLLWQMNAAYESLGQSGRPVMAVWGEADRLTPFESKERLLAVAPAVQLHALPGVGHLPHLERADLVVALISDFLRERGG